MPLQSFDRYLPLPLGSKCSPQWTLCDTQLSTSQIRDFLGKRLCGTCRKGTSLSFQLFFLTFCCNPGLAWDGYKVENGEAIEVETYDHQGQGEGPVEYYDYETGEYRTGYLDMYPGGSGTITDDETGEEIEVEMD